MQNINSHYEVGNTVFAQLAKPCQDDDAKKRKTLATKTQCSKSFLMIYKVKFTAIKYFSQICTTNSDPKHVHMYLLTEVIKVVRLYSRRSRRST